MDYYYRIHILKNGDSGNGHAFIELGSPTGTTYYELNTNPLFAGTGLTKVLSNLQDVSDQFVPAPGHPELWDGKVNSTHILQDFLSHLDGNKHVASVKMEVSELSFFQMQTYADLRALANGGLADYGLFGNSCITFVDAVLKAGGVQTPISSLFTSADMLITGDTWVWYHGLLLDVPRPGAGGPTALDAITKYAAEIGFLPPDKTPVMSVAAEEIQQWLGRPFNPTRADFDQIKFGLADGILPASIDFVSTTGNERYLASNSSFENRFVFSGDQNGLALSIVTSGFLAQIISYPVNGTRIDQIFDWADTQPWSKRTENRDTNETVTSVETKYGNGTRNVAIFDVAGVQNWSVHIDNYDVNGNRVSDQNDYRDNTHAISQYDVSGQNWAWVSTFYNANWAATWEAKGFDSGERRERGNLSSSMCRRPTIQKLFHDLGNRRKLELPFCHSHAASLSSQSGILLS
jgi:hypothetical protein